MPMQDMIMICPCCGHRLVFSAAVEAATPITGTDIEMIARELGIEVGLKGGEEIGD